MSEGRKSVLFIDDDADVRKTARLLLEKRGFAFYGAENPDSALSRLEATPVDVILLDLNFARGQTSGAEGLNCLRDILRHDPRANVIVVTGHSGLSIAVQALRLGARDFIMKPWHNERLVEAIERARKETRNETRHDIRHEMPSESPPETALPDLSVLVGKSEAIRRAKAGIDRCAPLTASVLLRGEAGTGKTLAATVLHRQSGRARMVQVDAQALEMSHLSGLENTTLLVENIDHLPVGLASGVLAWISQAPRHNNRLVSTTTLSGELGLDRGLLYAASTLEIDLPPLRERREDIVPLAEHFLRVICQQHGFAPKHLTLEAQSRLMAHVWGDNVHALRHLIERAAILVDAEALTPTDFVFPETAADTRAQAPRLADSEKTLIEEALRRAGFNVSAAAQALGLSRPALYRRMSKYGL